LYFLSLYHCFTENFEASTTAAEAAASLQVALEEISRLKGESAVYEGLL
jgi:hypothetical protein